MRAPHTSRAVSSSMLLQKGKRPPGLLPAASRESREKEEKPPKRDGFCWNRCVRESNNLSRLRGRSPRFKERGGWGQTCLQCPSFIPPPQPPASEGGSAPP